MFTPEGTHVLFKNGGRGLIPYMPFMFTFLGKIMSLKMNLLTGRGGVVCATEGGRHPLSSPVTVSLPLPRCQT